MKPLDFESLLKQTIGLDVASIGSSAIGYAVQARQAACKLDDPLAYWDLLRASEMELQALIDAVVVPETWFFRDRDAFTALASLALDEWLPRSPQGTLRLLSLPCASGEEPYSLAMALLDAGFPADRCSIDAVDVSARILMHARRAIYGKNSFRGGELEFRNRHFQATEQGHALSDAVRGQVQFHRGNLLAAEPVLGTRVYDIIFCRNLLIYFDRPTQDRAVQVLQRLLAPDGMLFVGPSETGLLLGHGFTSTKLPLAFAFRKSTAVPQTSAVVEAPPPHRRPDRSRSAAPQLAAAKMPPKRVTERPAVGVDGLTEARQLADQGRLADAEARCEQYLRQHGASAEVFQLLGLIHAAAGNLLQADHFYRKALYLDQDHCDTLVHFAWLLEKRGDVAGARVLRSRVSRLEQKLAK